MAYLDNNNGYLYSKGDPLEELDRELAQLKEELNELEARSEDKKETEKEPEDKHGGKRRVPLAVLALVLCAALLACMCCGFSGGSPMLFACTSGSGGPAVSNGGTVTIDDSEMGTIVLETVEGAEVSTYSKYNLEKDENGYYVYKEDGKVISHLGVDISEYQGEVDFAAVKAAGADFVILRIGGRYYGDEGKLYEDSAFDTYYEQAKAAGLKVGAYFFSQAASVKDAEEEAAAAIKKLNGRTLDYPLAFDWENIGDEPARTDDITGSELTKIAEAFCDAVNKAGYKSIVYANSAQMFIMYDFNTMKDYDFWLADYRDFPTMFYHYDMWQYSDSGEIDGIEGTVDLNISFTDFSE